MKKMKVVFSVFSVLGILAIGGFSISCTPNHITQYYTVYRADKIKVFRVLADKSCNRARLLFTTYGLAIYKYGNKYIARFTLITNKTDTVPTYVSIRDNILYIWLKDGTVINVNGVTANASFNTDFDIETQSMPNTINVFWDIYLYGNLDCRYQVEAVNLSTEVNVFSKHKNGSAYNLLKEGFGSGSSEYIAVK